MKTTKELIEKFKNTHVKKSSEKKPVVSRVKKDKKNEKQDV